MTKTVKIYDKEESLLRIINIIRGAKIDRTWMLELEPTAKHYVVE